MTSVTPKKQISRGKPWFRVLKKLTSLRYKPTTFCYLGKPFENGSLIISNHEGTDAPMALECYLDAPLCFWGAHEMCEGLPSLYRYQSKVYYGEKKHWHPIASHAFCLIASPVTNLFYKGLPLIPTYRDARFYKTIKQSVKAIEANKSIVIFPEHSENGYQNELEGFYGGFLQLAKHLYKKDIDVPIVVSYFQKAKNRYIFDEPIAYSALREQYPADADAIDYLLSRCNTLGRLDFT